MHASHAARILFQTNFDSSLAPRNFRGMLPLFRWRSPSVASSTSSRLKLFKLANECPVGTMCPLLAV